MKVNITKIMFSHGNNMARYLWICALMAVLFLGSLIPCHAEIAYYNIFVILGEDNPGKIYQLKIFPIGKIQDTYIQYTVGGNGLETGQLAVTNDYNFLFVSTGVAIDRYRIQSDGSLFALGSTVTPTGTPSFIITPNNKLLITEGAYGNGTIFSITTSGNLINGTSGPTSIFYNPKADPLGRGILAQSSGSTFSAYTINYNNNTLSLTTTFLIDSISNENHYFTFTSDGKLGFIYNFNPDLWVLNIDSGFNITTTSQIFNNPPGGIDEPAISSDNKYMWVQFGTYIELLTISTTEQVIDTGKKYYVLDSTTGKIPRFQKNTPDDRLLVVEYEDESLGPESGSFATAIIAGDGSLLWTGYTFAFDSAHPSPGTIVDYVIVPVYTTSVPYEFWKDLDDKRYLPESCP